MRHVGETVARSLVSARADGLVLQFASTLVRRRTRGRRVAEWLGWHLGQVAGGAPRIARLRSGSRMLVDIRDYAHRHLFLHGVYEDDLTALFRRLATPGWTVLDVGANVGYFSLLAADLGGGDSRVVAFEPQERVAAMLRRTLELNMAGRVELIESACGDRDGTVGLSLSPDPRNTGLATVRSSGSLAVTSEVPIIRLDRFCATYDLTPDLMKIDVEGTEEAVLRGAERLIARGIPRSVICEVWPESRKAVIAYMAVHGYSAFGINADGSLTSARNMASTWSNLIFQRAGG